MFTGIITAIGRIHAIDTLGHPSGSDNNQHGLRLWIDTPQGYLDDVQSGDSIALNGACMTATQLDAAKARFSVDISRESLNKTTGLDKIGPVNLEKALRASDRLGGHLVSGHVDGLGTVTHFASIGESWQLRLILPQSLARFLAYKGSVTVNGVSLTVNQVQDTPNGCEISINLIPHTVQNTVLHLLKVDDPVNIEIDLIARYVERMLSAEK